MMGNSPSNRRVTVVNDDVIGVVQVSENVIRRLKGQPEKPTPNSETPEPPKPAPEQRPSPKDQAYVHYAPPEPYSTTIEQRQKYHDEYLKAEKSWNNRIHELQSQNKVLLEASKKEFNAILSDVESNHMKNSYAPVCPDKQQKVLTCYKDNVKLPLNCSREVNEFMECVDKIRLTALSK